MSNYVIDGDWSDAYYQNYRPFVIQDAPLRDRRTGTVYAEGAMRVVDERTGKVVKTFKGECAWMNAERLASDMAVKERYS